MIEIKFLGRGGQGVVMASEILGRAFFTEGKYPQCFSLFGGERRGAPVVGFLRVDRAPILLKCQIKNPDQMILFDLSLTNERELLQELKPKGLLLINSNKEIEYFQNLRRFKLGLINAGQIAKDVGLGGTFNMALLGAYVRLTGLIKIESLLASVKRIMPAKKELNMELVQEAYNKTRVFTREG